MKRYLTTILLFIYFAAVSGQSHLNIAPVFYETKRWTHMFTGAHIEGKHLKPYNLTLFKSCTTSDHRNYDEMEQLVEKDGKNAIDKECGYINGKLYYAFYLLKPIKDKYQYIFYRNSSLRKDEPNEVTLVYMEGYVSLKELKNMFKNK